MADLTTIETAALTFSEDLKRLTALYTDEESEIAEIKAKRKESIEKLTKACNEHMKLLEKYISESSELFEKPKTRTFGKIKVGFVKNKDTFDISDVKTVLGRIKRYLPNRFDSVARVEATISIDAVKQLSDAELQLAGIVKNAGKEQPKVTLVDVSNSIKKLIERG